MDRKSLELEVAAETVGQRFIVLDNQQSDRFGSGLRFVHSYNCNPRPTNQMQDSSFKMEDPPDRPHGLFAILYLASCISC